MSFSTPKEPTMTELLKASHQWATRPADERFTSLTELAKFKHEVRDRSRARVVSSRRIEAVPVQGDQRALAVVTEDGPVVPTNWSFNQLAQRAEAPASYLRKLRPDLAADCVNYGLQRRSVEDVGLLVTANENLPATLAAATGPNYGRIWDCDLVDNLIDRFGDGVNGDFKVPGEFGKHVPITKANSTLYASDRDIFVFLADEQHRIEVPNRRNGEPGLLARGFFLSNSEVGAGTLEISTFLFDYVCCNRIVWGAEGVKTFSIRHTSGAPDRFVEEVAPALIAYSAGSERSVVEAVEAAKAKRIEEVDDFLNARFTRSQAKAIVLAHEADEGRPIETVWDAVTGITAYARGIEHQDARVDLERAAGKVLKLAA